MARMRHFLKRCPAVLLSAALLAAAVGTAAAADTPAPTLGIYTTGDMGGRLYREDPVTGEAVEYSYQNVASAMEAERASVDAALLLDSGDAVDNGLVQDGGAAEALALRAIGYDALVPAVGEFRLGPEARDDFFAALGEASEDGAPVRVLSGNYLDEDTQSPEEDAYEVFTVELGRRAVRIGVLGLGAMEAPEELPESFVSGVRFAHRDNTSGSYSWEWTGYWQERLEKENCDLVVVVCHAGQDELARFAAETTGIDLLVGGHGEAAAETLQNADGEPVSLTPLEYSILRLLMETPGKVFSSDEIYQAVWNDAPYGANATVAVHIRHLREKLEIDPANPRYLKVLWGHGYKMEADNG